MHPSLLLLLVALAVSSSYAHPAFQQRFNNLVDSNPCLKSCMSQVEESGLELNMLKTANLSGYLLNLDSICGVISSARKCIDSCGVPSNPFALESMNVMCSPLALAEVGQTKQCLEQRGNDIGEQCKSACGDHEQINQQIRTISQQSNRQQRAEEAMGLVRQACSTLKCSDRCAVQMLYDQCENAGQVVKALVERVISAQRRDLERMHLLDTMARSTPKECSFMYDPAAMFNDTMESPMENKREEVSTNVEGKTRPVLQQLGAYILEKQLQLLELKERNLLKENKKLDLELQMLIRKRLDRNSEEVPRF